jgi:O-antigen ligase
METPRIANLTFWIGMAGYAFFSPLSIAAQQIFFGLALAGFLVYVAAIPGRNQLILPPKAIIILMALYTVYRFTAMVVNHSDLIMIKKEWLFFMVVTGAVMLRNIKNLLWILDFFAAGVIAISAYGIWQHFIGLDLYHHLLLDKMTYGYRARGTFSTYLTYSGFLAVATIFLVPIGFTATNKLRKYVYLIASQISLASVLFNYSRSSIVALIIGVIILVLLIEVRYRKWVSLILLLTLAFGIVISPDFLSRFDNLAQNEFTTAHANSRLAIWDTALKMVKQSPAFGIGPGKFMGKYIELRKNRTGRDLTHAHNDFLNAAAEAGIPCAVFLISLWAAVLWYLYQGYRRCPVGFQKGVILGALLGSIVFLVMAQFEAFFSDEEVRTLLMFVWGTGLAVLGNLKVSEQLSEIA